MTNELVTLKGLTPEQNKDFNEMIKALISSGLSETQAYGIASARFKTKFNLNESLVEGLSIDIAESVNFHVENPFVIKESFVEDNGDETVIIEGLAIESGISGNGRVYISEEVGKNHESLVGKGFGIDHTQSARDLVGRIKSVEFNEGKLMHNTQIWNTSDYPDAVNRFKRGILKETSIRLNADKVYKINYENEQLYFAEGITYKGLDAVKDPGIVTSQATVMENHPIGITEAFSTNDNLEASHGLISNIGAESDSEEINMSDEINTKISALEETVVKLTESVKTKEVSINELVSKIEVLESNTESKDKFTALEESVKEITESLKSKDEEITALKESLETKGKTSTQSSESATIMEECISNKVGKEREIYLDKPLY